MAKSRVNESVRKQLQVRRGINGFGLFASAPIKKGEYIIEYIGTVLTEKQANERGGKYLFQTSANRHIDGTTRSNIARYINHSCRPNCETDIIKGRIYVQTRRKIEAGEELFYDYGKDYWEEHIKPKGCRCEKCLEKKKK